MCDAYRRLKIKDVVVKGIAFGEIDLLRRKAAPTRLSKLTSVFGHGAYLGFGARGRFIGGPTSKRLDPLASHMGERPPEAEGELNCPRIPAPTHEGRWRGSGTGCSHGLRLHHGFEHASATRKSCTLAGL